MTRLLAGLIGLFSLIALIPVAAEAQASDTVAGGFENQEYDIRGSWTIETREDGRYLVLSEDFRTRRGPDLKIFFSSDSADNVTGDNAADGFFLTALDSNRGAQEYRLPEDLDLADYASVVIHCERFSKLWGAGNL